MYAIINTGGKQLRVSVGDVVDVELLDANPGSCVTFSEVLFVNDGTTNHVGKPHLSDFPVQAEMIGMVSGEKVTGLKYKRSHNQRRTWGHRQKYSRVKITKIGN